MREAGGSGPGAHDHARDLRTFARTGLSCQFGNSFPLFEHYGVPLWVPEVNG